MGLSHSPSIVTSNLVLCFDPANPKSYSGSGNTIYDLTGRILPGALTNGPTYNSNLGGFLSFDGTNDYLAVPDSNLLDLGANFTISAWIKLNDLSNAYHSIFNSLNLNGSNTYGVALRWFRDNSVGVNAKSLMIQYGMNAAAWNVYSSDTNTVNDLNIHHVVVSVSAANTNNPTISFYLDGVLKTTTWWGQSTKTAISYSSDISAIRIAHVYTPANASYYNTFANINVYNLQVYKRALSSSEIKQNFDATKNKYIYPSPIITDNLVLNLDAGTYLSYSPSTSWYDASGNTSYILTARNSPTYVDAGLASYFTLNGSNQDFYLASYGPTFTEMTFNLWVWRNGAQNGYAGLIVNRGNASGFLYQTAGTNIGYFWLNSGFDYSSGVDTTNQTWTMATLVVTPTEAKWYLNGVLRNTRIASHASNTFSNLYIGSDAGQAGRYYNGRIAMVQMYNRALTSTEILQNFNATRGRYGV